MNERLYSKLFFDSGLCRLLNFRKFQNFASIKVSKPLTATEKLIIELGIKTPNRDLDLEI